MPAKIDQKKFKRINPTYLKQIFCQEIDHSLFIHNERCELFYWRIEYVTKETSYKYGESHIRGFGSCKLRMTFVAFKLLV